MNDCLVISNYFLSEFFSSFILPIATLSGAARSDRPEHLRSAFQYTLAALADGAIQLLNPSEVTLNAMFRY